MKKLKYTWQEFDEDVNIIIKYIKSNKLNIKCIYGIPKGGLPLAVTLANKLNLPLYTVLYWALEQSRPEGILLIDDVSDFGNTLSNIKDIKLYKTITLFIKPQTKFKPNFWCRECKDNIWIEFPWE